MNERMRKKIGKGLKKIGKEKLLRIYKMLESKKILEGQTDIPEEQNLIVFVNQSSLIHSANLIKCYTAR